MESAADSHKQVSLNYALGVMTKSWTWRLGPWQLPVTPLATWGTGILLLYSKEFLKHELTFRNCLGEAMAPLDDVQGIMQWWNSANLVMLKMVSFGMDKHWSLTGGKKLEALPFSSDSQPQILDYEGLDYKTRERESVPPAMYSYGWYLAYVFYMPLFLAGPTIPFNAFASQVLVAQTSMTNKDVAIYVARLGFCLLCMEVFTHYFYVYALGTEQAYTHFSPFELSTFGYWCLKLIWFKFLIIWRFFRLWAMLDGVETPENMNRCMSNNFTIGGFWRSWHRSFNQWLIRYLYVPLGGKRNKFVNIWVVFTFVALWHDVNLKLVMWGWLLCVFFLPELISGILMAGKLKWLKQEWYYRYIVMLAGSMNVMMLMCANIVGFSTGVKGISHFMDTLANRQAISTLMFFTVWFFVGTGIMLEWRGYERRFQQGPKDF